MVVISQAVSRIFFTLATMPTEQSHNFAISAYVFTPLASFGNTLCMALAAFSVVLVCVMGCNIHHKAVNEVNDAVVRFSF